MRGRERKRGRMRGRVRGLKGREERDEVVSNPRVGCRVVVLQKLHLLSALTRVVKSR